MLSAPPAAAEFDALLASDAWRSLLTHCPSVNLFDALSLALRENPSSRALALLLGSGEDHGLGSQLFHNWLDELIHDLRAGKATSSATDHAQMIESLGFLRTPVTRASTEWSTDEGRRVDMLIRCQSRGGEVVGIVGVENKHWAGEQENQVEHYQQALETHWQGKGIIRFLLYLTPYGSRPTTGTPNPECPWIAASYSTVLRAMHSAERGAPPSTALLLRDLRNHLAKEFEMDEESDQNEVRKLVESLWAHEEHRRVLDWIREYSPTVRTLADRLVKRMDGRFREAGLEQPSPYFYPVRSHDLKCLLWYPFKQDAKVGANAWPCLMITPDEDEERWSVGSKMRAAWMLEGCNDTKKQPVALASAGVAHGPDENLAKRWTWISWIPVWIGSRTYTLTGDFLAGDLAGLEQLVEEALQATPPGWKRNLLGASGT